MKIRYIYIFLSLAFTLPCLAQWGDYELNNGATAPVATFRSTGALTASGSPYAASPLIDEYGQADIAGVLGSPQRAARRAGTGTPSTPGTGGVKQPIGDAVLPLLMMTVALGVYRTVRRRSRPN